MRKCICLKRSGRSCTAYIYKACTQQIKANKQGFDEHLRGILQQQINEDLL